MLVDWRAIDHNRTAHGFDADDAHIDRPWPEAPDLSQFDLLALAWTDEIRARRRAARERLAETKAAR